MCGLLGGAVSDCLQNQEELFLIVKGIERRDKEDPVEAAGINTS